MADDPKTDQKKEDPAALAAAVAKLAENQTALTASLATMAAGQKQLLERLESSTAEKPAKTDGGEGKAITEERIAELLDQREQRRQQSDDVARRKAAALGGEKGKDLPDAYKRLVGDDPAKWDAELAAAREQFHADHKAAGNAPPKDVGGGDPGGRPPAAVVDTSKMNAMQELQLGLKNQRSGTPVQVAPPAPDAAK